MYCADCLADRSVTRLQLVLQMVEELGSDILTEPTQIIAFVAHALEADQATPWKAEQQATSGVPARARAESPDIGIKLSDLKFVDDDAIERAEHEKDDTEEQPVIPGLGHDEMAMTALTLLLAVLEGERCKTCMNSESVGVADTTSHSPRESHDVQYTIIGADLRKARRARRNRL